MEIGLVQTMALQLHMNILTEITTRGHSTSTMLVEQRQLSHSYGLVICSKSPNHSYVQG